MLIDQMFPFAANETEGAVAQSIPLHVEHASQLGAIIELMDQIPTELITLSGEQYGVLVVAKAAVRTAIDTWLSLPNKALLQIHLSPLPRFGTLNPVSLIRRTLVLCPDEGPIATTSDLTFIVDAGLRDSLRRDLGSVETALANGEWKGATVLAGSVVEALLLWSLAQRSVEVATATSRPGKPLEEWDLHQFLVVAIEIRVITKETEIQARLAKDYRNLIHPGRSLRLAQVCDRATALTAVAAMEHVIRDLT
jgi:hypothetical protein